MAIKHFLSTAGGLPGRQLRPEIMDRPGLDKTKHRNALAGLRRLNLASGICRQLCHELVRYSRARRVTKLKVLDIASGGGDVALGLWRRARKRGLDLQILGLDVSAAACDFANEQCREATGSITFDQLDVIANPLPAEFDVVTCSLFLHHLTHDQASRLLRKMAASGPLLLASDLRRCASGYFMAQLACHCLTSSPVVRYDGPQSVANAFTLSEMRELCNDAGLVDATIRKAWPCRLLLKRQEG
jgi:2-polyprenyl-3-methyl-5-hydroxy-6-metoxy-1,4-benzoquinol methylase